MYILIYPSMCIYIYTYICIYIYAIICICFVPTFPIFPIKYPLNLIVYPHFPTCLSHVLSFFSGWSHLHRLVVILAPKKEGNYPLANVYIYNDGKSRENALFLRPFSIANCYIVITREHPYTEHWSVVSPTWVLFLQGNLNFHLQKLANTDKTN